MMLHPMFCLLAAFALLCLAMERHHEEALGQAPSPRRQRALRGLAVLALLASAWALPARADWGLAWAAWFAQLSPAALFATLLATWWPRYLPAGATGSALVAVLLGVLAF